MRLQADEAVYALHPSGGERSKGLLNNRLLNQNVTQR